MLFIKFWLFLLFLSSIKLALLFGENCLCLNFCDHRFCFLQHQTKCRHILNTDDNVFVSFCRRWRGMQKQEQLLWERAMLDQEEQNWYRQNYPNAILWIMLAFIQNPHYPSLQSTEKFSRSSEQGRRGRMNLDHPRIIDVQNYRYAPSQILFSCQ